MALDSNNPAGYVQLANALELTGDTQESAHLMQKAIRLDPYSSPAHAAARNGDVDAIRTLISEGANVDTKD